MTSQLLRSDFEVPEDFPSEQFKAIETRFLESRPAESLITWLEFVGGWAGLVYRYRSCYEHHNAFIEHARSQAYVDSESELYRLESELFGFFVSGLATIESVCYGLYVIGSTLRPSLFCIRRDPNTSHPPRARRSDLRKIDVSATAKKFEEAYSSEAIARALRSIVDSSELKEWGDIRNILAHRAVPPRVTGQSGEVIRPQLWIPAGYMPEMALDESLTTSRRQWLVQAIRELLLAADDFTASHVLKPEDAAAASPQVGDSTQESGPSVWFGFYDGRGSGSSISLGGAEMPSEPAEPGGYITRSALQQIKDWAKRSFAHRDEVTITVSTDDFGIWMGTADDGQIFHASETSNP